MSRATKDPAKGRRDIALAEYVDRLRAGDRTYLGRAITLIESNRADDQRQAQALVTALLPHTGQAQRIGITGVPGVGKSTFIGRLGLNLTAAGHRVAVLAVDPSSSLSGGSILGDKTRMVELSRDDHAFIRPSPSGGSLGGVARKTRETMLLCEAAGFDVVLVETVGVGQAETTVSEMVDVFLLLMLAGAGDELQGIKRGVLELADIVAINKADGDNLTQAERARRDYASALGYLRPKDAHWTPRVLTCSGLTNAGLEALWQVLEEHRQVMEQSGQLQVRRQAQSLQWMWSIVEQELASALRSHPAVRARLQTIEAEVEAGRLGPTAAAQQLLEAFGLPSS